MTNRRDALKIIGAIGVTCAFPFSANELYGQHVHPEAEMAPQQALPGEPFEPQFFALSQMPLISCLADLIIPASETPGASESGVPQYIDRIVKQEVKLQPIFRDGLANLDATTASRFAASSFLQLSNDQQVEILTDLSHAADPAFFNALKGLTVDGYYTSRIGLLQELGYNGNDYLAAFPAFQIAEH